MLPRFGQAAGGARIEVEVGLRPLFSHLRRRPRFRKNIKAEFLAKDSVQLRLIRPNQVPNRL